MVLRKTWMTSTLALGLLVLLGSGRLAAETRGIVGFGGTQWFGDKTKAKNTPTLFATVEIAIDSFPADAILDVGLRCETGAFKKGGNKPASKVKGTYEYTFYGRYMSDLDNREPLATRFRGLFVTGAAGLAVWRDSVPIPVPEGPCPACNRPDRVIVEVQVHPGNNKKVDTTSAVCELSSIVVLAAHPRETTDR